MIKPEYANIVILEVAPRKVLNFQRGVFDNMSIGDHPVVIAAEKQSSADISVQEKATWMTVRYDWMLLCLRMDDY